MKNLRRVVPLALAIAVSFGTMTGIQADPLPSGAEDAAPAKHADWKAKKREHHKRFAEKLGLTEEQQAEMKEIRESFYAVNKAEMDAAKADYKALFQKKRSGELSKEAFRVEKQALKAKYADLHEAKKSLKDAMHAVLTPEQREKAKAMFDRWHDKRGKKCHGKHRSHGQEADVETQQ